jgi:hypothetical protein
MYSRGSKIFFLVSKSKVKIPRYNLEPQNFTKGRFLENKKRKINRLNYDLDFLHL